MSLIETEFAGRVAIIRFNDPERLNPMTTDTVEALSDALKSAEAEARAVVLTGRGRGFCSGAALTGGGGGLGARAAAGEFDAGAGLESHFNPLILQLRHLSVPLVTAVHGAAAGVGCSIALMGDLIVADSTAYFLQAFRNIGLVPDGGSPYLLAAAAGRARAMEMMLLGERIPAETAYQWGLINRLVPAGEDLTTALELAQKLADGPRKTQMLIRELAWGALERNLPEQLAAERQTQKIAGGTAEFREGVIAFVQKRKANFGEIS